MNLKDPEKLELFYSLRFNYPAELIEDSVLEMVIEECPRSIEEILRRLTELTGVPYKLTDYMMSNELAFKCVRKRYPRLTASNSLADQSTFRKLIRSVRDFEKGSIFDGCCTKKGGVESKGEWRRVMVKGTSSAMETNDMCGRKVVDRDISSGGKSKSGEHRSCRDSSTGVGSTVDASGRRCDDFRLGVLLELFPSEGVKYLSEALLNNLSLESAVEAILLKVGQDQKSNGGGTAHSGRDRGPSSAGNSTPFSRNDDLPKKSGGHNVVRRGPDRPIRRFCNHTDDNASWREHLCKALQYYKYKKGIPNVGMVCKHDRLVLMAISEAQAQYIDYHVSRAVECVFNHKLATVDLHGFNLQISLKFVTGLLETWYNCPREKLTRWRLCIVTGRGNHSKKGPILTSMVMEQLREYGLAYRHINQGTIECVFS